MSLPVSLPPTITLLVADDKRDQKLLRHEIQKADVTALYRQGEDDIIITKIEESAPATTPR